MKHIFYFLGIIPFMMEMYVFMNPAKVTAFIARAKGKKTDDILPKEWLFGMLNIAYLVWCFIGIFSFQWPIFLFIVAISFIPKKWAWVRFVDAVVSALLILFILLNAYHFQLGPKDILNLFTN